MAETLKKHRFLLICLALTAATVVAYEPIRHNDFVKYDDQSYITENPNVTCGLTWSSVKWAFTTSHTGYPHPITWLSHMLDCEIYGLKPVGHHITNLLFHIANFLLLFWLLQKMTKVIWKSAFVAAAFALHPVHVESVAWAAERKDVLSTLFWMLTIWAYVRYIEKQGIGRYMLVILALVMGLMSKPMVVTLPFVLILLDFWPLNRFLNSQFKFLNSIIEKLPFFFLAVISSIITYITQQKSGSIVGQEFFKLGERVSYALVSYISYIGKIIYPANLAVLYPYLVAGLPNWKVISAGVLLVVITAWVILAYRKKRYLLFGWLWYLGTLVPVIGIVHIGIQAMSDRYAYLPSIGIFIIAAWGMGEILAKLPGLKPVSTVSSIAVLSGMVLLTRIQVGYWRDSSTLFQRAIAVTKNNYVMHDNYGRCLLREDKYDEARQQFKEAIRSFPNYMPARQNFCATYLKEKKYDEAISCFSEEIRTIRDWSEMYNIYYSLGYAYQQKGNLTAAEINYRKALELKPDYKPAGNNLNNLGKILTMEGKLDEAISCFNYLINHKQATAEVYYNLAVAMGKQGKNDEAVGYFKESLRQDPGNLDARQKLGNVLMATGKAGEAILCLKESLQINPDQPQVYMMLGAIYEQAGDYKSAIPNWTKAVELSPDNANALNSLAWLLATSGEVSAENADKAVRFAERSCELTGYKNAMILDTLAAAYAAAGRFEDAVTMANKAVEATRAAGQKDIIGAIQDHLELFKKGQPYHEKMK